MSAVVAVENGDRALAPARALAATGTAPSDALSAESLRTLFTRQRKFLDHFFDSVDYAPIAAFCEACAACEGSILFTGVGKSGFIAQKICMTMVSTGTRAQFLSPVDALHGDIGLLGPSDLLVMFSKSGSTEELLRLVPFARAKGARLVSVTSVPDSALERVCDQGVLLPLQRELCPFDLAPVTSTGIQMLFGDTVAIALMQAKALTQDEYAMNHPAGRIGRRLILRVSHVMAAGDAVPLVSPDAPLSEVLGELSAKGCGCVVVVGSTPGVEGDATGSDQSSDTTLIKATPPTRTLLGMFTDGDLRRALQRSGGAPDLLSAPVSRFMTASPRSVASDVKAVHAMQAMELAPKVSALPVVDAGSVVGIVTLHALISAGI